MDQTRGHGSIQMLLSAEHEAQQIVADARNLKLARLRHAKEEADREVACYRAQMEADYQKSLSESFGSSDSVVKRLESETEAKIKSLKETAGKVSPEVVKMLLKHIVIVKS
ncbi:V-type proton ATPase subunit G-like [Salvia miltiorrhiza]|uniref:V-type proton ATPase subunit G-like n=1 Tax=Salvia miltiorrhiza TaxID=226208 RepID=UPI0025AD696F|nr:V-type proton ATPase subunit G-like [Salvia miltiorrhiza]